MNNFLGSTIKQKKRKENYLYIQNMNCITIKNALNMKMPLYNIVMILDANEYINAALYQLTH